MAYTALVSFVVKGWILKSILLFSRRLQSIYVPSFHLLVLQSSPSNFLEIGAKVLDNLKPQKE